MTKFFILITAIFLQGTVNADEIEQKNKITQDTDVSNVDQNSDQDANREEKYKVNNGIFSKEYIKSISNKIENAPKKAAQTIIKSTEYMKKIKDYIKIIENQTNIISTNSNSQDVISENTEQEVVVDLKKDYLMLQGIIYKDSKNWIIFINDEKYSSQDQDRHIHLTKDIQINSVHKDRVSFNIYMGYDSPEKEQTKTPEEIDTEGETIATEAVVKSKNEFKIAEETKIITLGIDEVLCRKDMSILSIKSRINIHTS